MSAQKETRTYTIKDGVIILLYSGVKLDAK